jgi:hypothetical protein
MRDLTDIPKDSDELAKARQQLIEHPLIKRLIKDSLANGEFILSGDDKCLMPHQKLRILIDFGMNNRDIQIKPILDNLKSKFDKGRYLIKQQVPKSENTYGINNNWITLSCEAPIITYMLLKSGENSSEVISSVNTFKTYWSTKLGWFCDMFSINNQYKKLNIGCPMAGLMSLEIFSQLPSLEKTGILKNAFEPLKFHREYKKTLYYFGRSKRFWTFNYPFVIYNALYMADVLSRFKIFRNEELYKELISWIEYNLDNNNDKIKANSSNQDNYQKEINGYNEPSPWLTYLALRILKRHYSHI